jgi:hypothetical protein
VSNNDVEVKFGGSLEELQRSITEAKSQLGEFAEGAKSQAEGMGEAFTRLAEIVGVAFTVDAFKNWIEGSAELGEEIERTAAKLGISAQSASELQGMATMTGTSFDGLQTALERLQPQLAQAEQGTGRVAAALKVLDLNAKDMALAPVDQQLNMLAASVSRFADGATKTAAVQALGRGFVELLPLLDRGKEGLDELHDVLLRTGAVMSNEMAGSFAHTKEDLNELSLAWQGLSNKLFDVANGPIDLAIHKVTQLLESLKESDIRDGATRVAETAAEIASEIMKLCAEVEGAWQKMIAIINAGPGEIGAQIGNSLTSGIESWWAGSMVDIGQRLKDAGQLTQEELDHIKSSWDAALKSDSAGRTAADPLSSQLAEIDKNVAARVAELDQQGQRWKEAAKNFVNTPSTSEKPFYADWGTQAAAQVPQMNFSDVKAQAKEAAEAVKSAFQEAFDSARNDATLTTDSINNALKLHQISMQQWLQQTTAALDAEALAIIDADQKAEASAQLTSQQKIAIANREANELTAIAKKEADAQVKANEDAQKQMQGIADSVLGAWNSQLRGLLSGTENWHQATLKIAQDLTIKFIEWAEKMVVQWVVAEASKTAATTAGAAARTAAGAGEASAGILQDVAAAIKSIITSAAATFAGVFGFLAPILGPAAAAPAVAAQASVMGAVGMVASADIGMWQVPSDMLTLVHHNELVMPADQASAFRDMLGGAGSGGAAGGVHIHPTTNLHVSALDSGSVSQWMRSNSHEMLKSIDEAVRHGAHLGLRRLATS